MPHKKAGAKTASSTSRPEKSEGEDAIMERMNKALKKMMDTPHETQKEMIKRRRAQVTPRKR